MTKGGEIVEKNQGNHETYMSDAKKSGRHRDTERKTRDIKRNNYCICSGSHVFKRFPELKNLGTILWEGRQKIDKCQGKV